MELSLIRPGQRGYATGDDVPIVTTDDGDGWYVDAIHNNGSVVEQGHFERLDLAYFYGHLIALARSRTVRQGLTLSPIVAITAADMVYIIAELLDDETAVHYAEPDLPDLRGRAVRLGLEILAGHNEGAVPE